MSDQSNAKTNVRPPAIVMEPFEANEAEGVLIRRTIGSDRLVLLDPFLLFDHLQVTLTDGAGSLGFPRHPHRGIETLTYVLSGRVHHRDSLGNDSSVGANGSQWMTAGGGIFHEEMLEREASDSGPIEALQLWFNMPAASKMIRPGYQPASDEAIPRIALDGGATARVVAGAFGGATGPFKGIAVQPTCVDIALPAAQSVRFPVPADQTAFVYVIRGDVTIGAGEFAKGVTSPRLVILGDGDQVQLTAQTESRFLFVAAKPLNEPVLQYRSLVMNTIEQMREALTDLERGTFARS